MLSRDEELRDRGVYWPSQTDRLALIRSYSTSVAPVDGRPIASRRNDVKYHATKINFRWLQWRIYALRTQHENKINAASLKTRCLGYSNINIHIYTIQASSGLVIYFLIFLLPWTEIFVISFYLCDRRKKGYIWLEMK